MAIVITDDQHYADIADVIRANGPYPEGTFKPEELAQNIQYAINYQQSNGLDAGATYGRQAEYDRFWDAYQDNGNRTGYEYAFAGKGWTPENFKPKYDMNCVRSDYMFARMRIQTDSVFNLREILEQAGVTLDTSKSDNLNFMFFECLYVTEVPHIDLSKAKYATNLFNYCLSLDTVSITVAENTVSSYSGWFSRCDALTNLTVSGVIDKSGFNVSQSPLLTVDSLMNILSCLKDYSADTSGTSWTCTLGTKNLAKLTDAEKAIATGKGWTLT